MKSKKFLAGPLGEPWKNPAAVALGKLGGSANTKAQNEARKRNSKLGGWPKGRPRKWISRIPSHHS